MVFDKNEYLTLTPNIRQHKTRNVTQCDRCEAGPWHRKQESTHSTKCIGTVLHARDKGGKKTEKKSSLYFVLNKVTPASEPSRFKEMRNSG